MRAKSLKKELTADEKKTVESQARRKQEKVRVRSVCHYYAALYWYISVICSLLFVFTGKEDDGTHSDVSSQVPATGVQLNLRFFGLD